jgi:hypothetical protein
MTLKATLRYKGGKGSGNFGHRGRPGKVGGSAGGTGGDGTVDYHSVQSVARELASAVKYKYVTAGSSMPKVRGDGEVASFSAGKSRFVNIKAKLEGMGFSEIDTSHTLAFSKGDLSREYRKSGSSVSIRVSPGPGSSSTDTWYVEKLPFNSD